MTTSSRTVRSWASSALVALVCACGGSKEQAPPPAEPPAPLRATCDASTHDVVGPACAPKFDACKPNELPRLGGGCEPVGVEPCAPGTTSDGAGGCDASVPACGPAELALPGEGCTRLAPCDDPIPASAIVVDKNVNAAIAAAPSGATIYLAAGEYAEDIVVDKPLTIVGRCPSMVTVRGTAVAITLRAAATIKSLSVTGSGRGIFAEGVTATLEAIHAHDLGDIALGGRDKEGPLSLTLERAVIERVASAGVATTGGTTTIEAVLIRNIGAGALEGYGILASGSVATMTPGDVRASRIAIEDTAFAGVGVVGAKTSVANAFVRRTGAVAIGTPAKTPIAAPLTIADAVIEDSAGHGVAANGVTTLDVQRTTIRRTRDTGLFVRDVGSATIFAAKIERGAGRGITLDRSPARVERTMVTGTAVRDGLGCGICGYSESAHRIELRTVVSRENAIGGLGVDGAELVVDGAVLERNGSVGLSVANANATVSNLVVRDTKGDGALAAFTKGRTARLTLWDSLFERNERAGLTLLAPATVERVLIRDTRPNGAGLGVGLIATLPTGHTTPNDVELRSVVVDKAVRAGMYFEVINALVDACAIRDVAADARGEFGDGIAFSAAQFTSTAMSFVVPSTARVTRTLVEYNARAGIAVFGSTVALSGSRLRCNRIDLDVEQAFNDTAVNPARIDDGGDNDCACTTPVASCRAQSNGLRPIAARE